MKGSESLRVAPREPRTGDVVSSKYALVRCVGQGGMGSVWVARNDRTGADVALKVLRRGKAEAADTIERFRHEARLGALLQHRSITRAFDFIEEPDGLLVLVMELLRGETLQNHLTRTGPLGAKEAVAIAVPILSALDHAHEMGVVHRDVKPANIYLAIEPDGQVVPKLLDFGIAKAQSHDFHTLEGRVLGTPAYMSPEQIRATTSELTGRSDLFSVGAVLYEMLTGSPPFGARTPSAALAAVLESTVDPDPRILPRLWVEIQRALAKRPNERFESAHVMAKALCEAIEESEEALSRVLRRSKPSPIQPEPSPAPEAPSDPSLADTRRGTQSIRPRHSPPKGWLAGAIVIVVGLTCLALASVIHKTPESKRQELPGMPAPSTSTVATAPSETRSTALPSTIAPMPSSATGTAKAAPRKPRAPKPIATTPGF